MKVLITGMKGFTGRYVEAAFVEAGHEVYGIGLHGPADGDRNYYQVDLDSVDALTACLALVKPDVVVHLAAIAFIAAADSEAFYRINLLGTRNLFVAVERVGSVNCLILASSGNVYGNQAVDAFSETSRPRPANEYAVSKLAMELMAGTWQERLPIIITRPFNYTGIGQSERFLVPKVVDHFRRREQRIELGNIEVRRDFCDVRSVAQVYRLLAERKPIGEILNICSGRLTSLREIIAACEEVAGYKIRIDVRQDLVRSNEIPALRGDPARLQNILSQWEVPPIKETIRWMLSGEGAAAGHDR